MEIISADAGTQFTSMEFQDECQPRGVCLTLEAPEHLEMNGQVEVTWRTLSKTACSLMVHVRVWEAYIHFVFIYTEDNIFPVLSIKDLINKDGDPTMQFKLATGTKSPLSYLLILFCPCVSQKTTAHVETKELNMCHQAQKGFCGIFVGIPQHQKEYLAYVPHT